MAIGNNLRVSSIAIVTCRNIPEPDPDEQLFLHKLQEAELEVQLIPWEDEDVDWSQFDLIVLRSTWNYYEYASAFREFILRIQPLGKLWNRPEVVLRNLDKRYLLDIEMQGIPIVPTRFLDDVGDLSEVLGETGWQRFVLKPTVSAGSYKTKAFDCTQLEEAELFLSDILTTSDAMVQVFMPRVEAGGEIALVHIDSKLTHGIIKQPRYQGQEESVSEAVQPNVKQAELAARVLALVSEPLLYARVDLMETEECDWVLSEMELVEPSLFLKQNPDALDRLVAAIQSRA